MKRTIILFLTLAMLATALTACGANQGGNQSQEDQKDKETQENLESREDQDVPEEQKSYIPREKIEGSSLYVKKVQNLPEDFILGMDVSTVLAEERSGVRYYNEDGVEQDLFQILAENGVTHIRVRVWNDPYDEQGHGFGGGNCDVETAAEIGRRAAQYGLKLIVDFHYSDFWADPKKQMAPRAWEGMDVNAKCDALYAFTRDSLQRILDAGGDVAMVQVGNETTGALCGEYSWKEIAALMQSGSRAVREVCPQSLVTLHFTEPANPGSFDEYAARLAEYGVDYDVFASSYYPFWHGTRENLIRVLTKIHQNYGKKVMVMETSFPYTGEDSDYSDNVINADYAASQDYPFTIQGQANAFRDVVDAVAQIPGGIGVCYWEGAWITVGGNSYAENQVLWEKYGSGWASSYAGVYDPVDAGQWYGGCAWDNQAFFGPDGRAMESLRVFNLVRWGNETEIRADAVEDCFVTVDLAGEMKLPETVRAFMTDGSVQNVPVRWDLDDAMREKMFADGPMEYEILGSAEGIPARCYVSMEGTALCNYLLNGNFETGDLSPWTVEGYADELYVEDKASDSLDGTWHMHFWSSGTDRVEFTLEQTVKELPEGVYAYQISIMGGDGGETEIYAYVKLNGTVIASAPLELLGFPNWDTALIPDISCAPGQTLTVGIYVRCQGVGAGAWGKIDCATLFAQA